MSADPGAESVGRTGCDACRKWGVARLRGAVGFVADLGPVADLNPVVNLCCVGIFIRVCAGGNLWSAGNLSSVGNLCSAGNLWSVGIFVRVWDFLTRGSVPLRHRMLLRMDAPFGGA